ncbi:ParB/RepB/Spo0J family partition protein [Actinokineospora sp. NBRC 105648]|uniref:ParB/RepB/Spo0J family partition protein n=1 Tax=Actinokineospora sp. NBRC 105648 TaxID=3032206 RepID=UPI0024A41FDD|nr:ParB/RepB/Spo0J family partition protein [Actinokineospora sp. NBRC 105648]GLZ43510.1 hypothetical protein Acsp05_71340 [Actinokineospora sp. NBRC 105648]
MTINPVAATDGTVQPTADLPAVHPAEVTAHPHNPRRHLGDLTELTASVAEHGVVQPLTVVSIDAYLTANPDAADQGLGVGNWVVVCGHRRLEAADRAGLDTVPIIVRDDLAPAQAALAVMLIENMQRADLSPIEEAEGMAALRDTGLSEREIAAVTGVSPGQVNKRLKLLKLPDTARAALESRELTVAAALKLLELPKGEVAAAWDAWRTAPANDRDKADPIGPWVEARKTRIATDKAVATLRQTVEAAGIEVVDNPATVLGWEYHRHRLPDETTLDQIASPADTLATIYNRTSGPVAAYFSRTIPLPADVEDDETDEGASDGSTDGPSVWEQHRQAQVSGHAAAAERDAACARLVAGELPADLVLDILSDAVCGEAPVGGHDSLDDAARWCGAPTDDEGEPLDALEDWLVAQGDTGGQARHRVAVALVLADLEGEIRYVRPGDWTSRDVRHVRRLVAHGGYELAEWERLGMPDDPRPL